MYVTIAPTTRGSARPERAQAPIQGGEEEDEGDRGFPERDECVDTCYGDSAGSSSKEWALKRYPTTETLTAVEKPNPQLPRR